MLLFERVGKCRRTGRNLTRGGNGAKNRTRMGEIALKGRRRVGAAWFSSPKWAADLGSFRNPSSGRKPAER